MIGIGFFELLIIAVIGFVLIAGLVTAVVLATRSRGRDDNL